MKREEKSRKKVDEIKKVQRREVEWKNITKEKMSRIGINLLYE